MIFCLSRNDIVDCLTSQFFQFPCPRIRLNPHNLASTTFLSPFSSQHQNMINFLALENHIIIIISKIPEWTHANPCNLSYLLIAKATDFNGFDRHVMENVKLIDASAEGTVTFEFFIDERYSNVNGVMRE